MFFRTKDTSVTGVVFDIGTVSVSATLFEVRKGDSRPHILKTFRKFHKASLKNDQAHFSKSTVTEFQAILADIKKELQGRSMPTYYTIGLSSIFYLAKSERFLIQNQTQKILTKFEVDGLIDKGKANFLAGLNRSDIVVFETVLMKSLLNGYVVDQPVGKNALEAELWVHYAATSKELHDTFEATIHTYRKDATISFFTLPIVAWGLMREIIFPEHASILVDIGGELTEVTFLVDGVVTEILSLPFGVVNILMRIAESERVDIENALSLLKAYTDGTLSKDAQMKIRAIIKSEIRNWEQIFERVWQRASQHMMANIRMFFLGGGALVSDMKDVIIPPLLHPDLAKGLHASLVSPDAFRDKFGTYCCFDGPGDFGLLALILMTRIR